MQYILHCQEDDEYIISDEDFVTIEGYEWYTFPDWVKLQKAGGTFPMAKVLYDETVFFEDIVHVAPSEVMEETEDLLRKIRRFVTEKKSSLSTILSIVPRVKIGRSKVPPLSVRESNQTAFIMVQMKMGRSSESPCI